MLETTIRRQFVLTFTKRFTMIIKKNYLTFNPAVTQNQYPSNNLTCTFSKIRTLSGGNHILNTKIRRQMCKFSQNELLLWQDLILVYLTLEHYKVVLTNLTPRKSEDKCEFFTKLSTTMGWSYLTLPNIRALWSGNQKKNRLEKHEKNLPSK